MKCKKENFAEDEKKVLTKEETTCIINTAGSRRDGRVVEGAGLENQ